LRMFRLTKISCCAGHSYVNDLRNEFLRYATQICMELGQ
jgi:hypothetical protein